MTETKAGRKRKYRPKPTIETQMLLADLMPWLGKNQAEVTDEDALSFLLTEYPKLAGYHIPEMPREVLQELRELLVRLWSNPKAVAHVKETLEICRDVIRIAVLKGYVHPGDFHEKFRDGLGTRKPNVSFWRSPGATHVRFVFPDPRETERFKTRDDEYFSVILKVLRSCALDVAVKAFSSWDGDTPNGAFFIGACKRCKRLFAKVREHKEVCSDSCRVVQCRENTGKKKGGKKNGRNDSR